MEQEKNAFVRTAAKPRTIPVIGFGRRLPATSIDGMILYIATFLLTVGIG